MPAPNIAVEFKKQADTSVRRGSNGVVALMFLKSQTSTQLFYTIKQESEIPAELSEGQKDFAKLCFMSDISQVLITITDDLETGFNILENKDFNYLSVFSDILDAEKIIAFVKAKRTEGKKIKAVLPNVSADYEGIINFTTTDIETDHKTYQTADYCSRIASLIATVPLTRSVTYYNVSDIIKVPHISKIERDTKVDNGEFIIFNDSRQNKVLSGVNSLKTITDDITDDYKDIKFIDTIDLIKSDLTALIEDNYIGQIMNTYDNKILLVSNVNTYLNTIYIKNLIDDGYSCSIDFDEQRKYIEDILKVDTSAMDDNEILEYNTKKSVFLIIKLRVTGAIENVNIRIYV